VILDAGWPPAEGADIVVTCNGQPLLAAHTDKKGEFSLPLDTNLIRAAPDAKTRSVVGYFSQRCGLQATFPGYKSATINLADLDSLYLGTIVLRPIAPGDGKPVTAAALAAPEEATKAFEKGRQALSAKRPQEARQQFEKAARIYPKYAAAWCELGKLRIEERDFDGARGLFQVAINADPQYLDPYLQLAALQAAARQWVELAETTEAALRLDAHDYPQAYYLNALANFNTQNLDAAESSAREAERFDRQQRFLGSWQILGRILMIRRQFAEAAEQMREYLWLVPEGPDADSVRSWLAEIEKLSGPGAPPD